MVKCPLILDLVFPPECVYKRCSLCLSIQNMLDRNKHYCLAMMMLSEIVIGMGEWELCVDNRKEKREEKKRKL